MDCVEVRRNLAAWLRVLEREPSKEYEEFVLERLATVEHPYTILGLISELGEVSNELAKSMRPNRILNYDHFLDELGDCYFYSVAGGIPYSAKHIIYRLLRFIANLPDHCFIDFVTVYGVKEVIQVVDLVDPSTRTLEQLNMEKLTKRKEETGSHLK